MASFSLLLPLIDKICNRNPYITHEPINRRHQSLEYKLTIFSNSFFGYDNNILSSVQFIRMDVNGVYGLRDREMKREDSQCEATSHVSIFEAEGCPRPKHSLIP